MRFVTACHDGVERVGVLVREQIWLVPPSGPGSKSSGPALLDLLGDDGERLHAAGEAALRDPLAILALDDARLRAPLPRPASIRDFMTFEQHVEGAAMLMGDGRVGPEWYELPVFYFTNPHAVVGPFDDVPVPPGCGRLDYEVEVAAVIGAAGRDLSVEQAQRHIVGYLIMNDWSARDLQRVEMRAHLGPVKGKDGATTLGPALVTADELAPWASGTSFDLRMQVEVNGRLLGQDRLSNMAWSFAEMTAYASRGAWIRPGDVLGSGTCGNGCLAEAWGRNGVDSVPPLKVGDVVTITVEQLGTISNRVVPGAPLHALAPRHGAGLPAETQSL